MNDDCSKANKISACCKSCFIRLHTESILLLSPELFYAFYAILDAPIKH